MPKKNRKEESKKAKGKVLKTNLRNSILELLDTNAGKAYNVNQITQRLRLKKREDIKLATLAIYQLEDDQLKRTIIKAEQELKDGKGIPHENVMADIKARYKL